MIKEVKDRVSLAPQESVCDLDHEKNTSLGMAIRPSMHKAGHAVAVSRTRRLRDLLIWQPSMAVHPQISVLKLTDCADVIVLLVMLVQLEVTVERK